MQRAAAYGQRRSGRALIFCHPHALKRFTILQACKLDFLSNFYIDQYTSN